MTRVEDTVYIIPNEELRQAQLKARANGAIWVPTGKDCTYELMWYRNRIEPICVYYHDSDYRLEDKIKLLKCNYKKIIVIAPSAYKYNELVSTVHNIDKNILIFPRFMKDLRLDYTDNSKFDVVCISTDILSEEEYEFIKPKVSSFITTDVTRQRRDKLREDFGDKAYIGTNYVDGGVYNIISFLYSTKD